MIGLLQRVTEGRVTIEGQTIGAIGAGLLVLIGVERGDGETQAERLFDRLLRYRVFADETGKMNRSLREISGGLLLIPQFTLAADTQKGLRPSFTPAAAPAEAEQLFNYLKKYARERHAPVAFGQFGADMRVYLINDGPVTFWLRNPPAPSG